MKYYSEETKKFYDSVEECEQAEKEARKTKEEKEQRQKLLKETRAARAKEVEDAFNKANELLNKFVEDYGSFHYTYNHCDPIDWFTKWLPW